MNILHGFYAIFSGTESKNIYSSAVLPIFLLILGQYIQGLLITLDRRGWPSGIYAIDCSYLFVYIVLPLFTE